MSKMEEMLDKVLKEAWAKEEAKKKVPLEHKVLTVEQVLKMTMKNKIWKEPWIAAPSKRLLLSWASAYLGIYEKYSPKEFGVGKITGKDIGPILGRMLSEGVKMFPMIHGKYDIYKDEYREYRMGWDSFINALGIVKFGLAVELAALGAPKYPFNDTWSVSPSWVFIQLSKGVEIDGIQHMLLRQQVDGSFSEMSYLQIDDCTFSNMRLAGSVFYKSQMEKCWFKGTDLRGANFVGATIKNCDFTLADLVGADFRMARIENSTFEAAYMDEVNLRGMSGMGLKDFKTDVSGVKI